MCIYVCVYVYDSGIHLLSVAMRGDGKGLARPMTRGLDPRTTKRHNVRVSSELIKLNILSAESVFSSVQLSTHYVFERGVFSFFILLSSV